jgi:hypothetical protein
MRRIAILVVLIALDMWLIGSSARSGGVTIPSVLNNSVSAQSCCAPGTGDSPYSRCVNGQCEEFPGCGFTDCSACQGCDPDDEAYCLDIGWIWNPEDCTCIPPGCDPNERAECIDSGCTWDDNTCTCTCPPICDPFARQQCLAEGCTWDDVTCTCTCQCIPGPPVLVGYDTETTSYCVGCYEAEDCVTETWYFVSFCQDGSIYDIWAEQTYYCYFGSDWGCEQWCELY